MSAVEITNLIAQHRQEVELGDAVNQLRRLPVFKLVFDSNLFQQRVTYLVSQLVNTVKPSPEYDAIVRELDSISYVQNYLHQVVSKGSEASEHIKEAQNFLHNNED